jgi:GTP-binding protein
LHPHLGVVRIGPEQSFVIADIPGLIEGAAQGTGLGIQFLKHLTRTRLLLHLVDIASCENIDEAVKNIHIIENELAEFGVGLDDRPRWLVLNKSDLLSEADAEKYRKAISKKIDKNIPVYLISAVSGRGCQELVKKIQAWMDQQKQEENIDN